MDKPKALLLAGIGRRLTGWIWLFVPWFITRLAEHRAFSWANEKIDHGGWVNLVKEAVAWMIANPALSFVFSVAVYCLAVIVHSQLAVARSSKKGGQAVVPQPESASPTKSASGLAHVVTALGGPKVILEFRPSKNYDTLARREKQMDFVARASGQDAFNVEITSARQGEFELRWTVPRNIREGTEVPVGLEIFWGGQRVWHTMETDQARMSAFFSGHRLKNLGLQKLVVPTVVSWTDYDGAPHRRQFNLRCEASDEKIYCDPDTV